MKTIAVLLATTALVSPSVSWGQWVNCGTAQCTSGKVGIGTGSPQWMLQVVTAGQSQYGTGLIGTDGHFEALFPSLESLNYNNITQAGDAGIIYSGGSPNSGGLVIAPWFAGLSGIRMDSNGNVGIGTASPQHMLQVAGTIGAKELVLSSTGADYVFEADYRLAPLGEVRDYIRANGHLPDIPSAREVEAKGVSVGEMQSKLLAKIEELTLHLIEAEKKSELLEGEIRELRQAVKSSGTNARESAEGSSR